jgi:hypothetical protein
MCVGLSLCVYMCVCVCLSVCYVCRSVCVCVCVCVWLGGGVCLCVQTVLTDVGPEKMKDYYLFSVTALPWCGKRLSRVDHVCAEKLIDLLFP